jgi:hypothetical protein
MIYFCTPNFIKLNTLVGENVDTQDLNYITKIAADTWVRSYLGTYFYNYLLTQFNSQSLNANEVILVQDYIQMCVAQRAAAEAIISTTYQLKNKGVQQQTGDFSTAPEFRVIPWVFERTRSQADFYDQRLIDYLVANKSLYPEFTSTLNTDSKVKTQYCNNSCGCGTTNCGCTSINAFQSGILFI